MSDIDRFMSFVDKLPNGCWFWTGARSRGKGNRKWYGSFWVSSKTKEGRLKKGVVVRAHRYACDVLGGNPIRPGEHRDHTCEFSLCVNPSHLEVVTLAENQRRKISRRRGVFA